MVREFDNGLYGVPSLAMGNTRPPASSPRRLRMSIGFSRVRRGSGRVVARKADEMQGFVLDPKHLGDPTTLVGVALAEEARIDGRRAFAKGHRLTASDVELLDRLDAPVHAVRLDPGDVHEDDAGARLARAVAGDGMDIRGPAQSRYNLVATKKGLLRIDADRLRALNLLPGVAVYTLPDRMVTLPGKVLAGVKITPVAVPEATLSEAEVIARDGEPIVRVLPFLPRLVGVVTTEAMKTGVRDRFRTNVERKIGWYGGSVLRFEEPAANPAAVAQAIAGLVADGADVVLAAGGNTIDPLDPTLLALPDVGAELLRLGAPAHPGSMFWIARAGDTPVINLASCSLYSQATTADLVLPWVMAGERVTRETLADLGHGGLLEKDMGWRFPPYDAEAEPGTNEG